MNRNGAVWITWETQRRSIELAKMFECELYVFDYNGILRYPKCIVKTLKVLASKYTDVIFVQNPSMVLAAVACLYKIIYGKKVIVDRHTTFKLDKKDTLRVSNLIFKALHKFTIKYADLTIVTNEFLANIVTNMGGRAYVLPDKLPDIRQTEKPQLIKGFSLLLISSFGHDEPIEEVLKCANMITKDGINLYVTGNTSKLSESVIKNAPSNVIFTGFLKEQDFVNIVFAVDAVMVLTTASYCMLCGCYEAIAAKKPLITSKSIVLEEYFTGSIFVQNTSSDIKDGIYELYNNYDAYLNNSKNLEKSLKRKWENTFTKLRAQLT